MPPVVRVPLPSFDAVTCAGLLSSAEETSAKTMATDDLFGRREDVAQECKPYDEAT